MAGRPCGFDPHPRQMHQINYLELIIEIWFPVGSAGKRVTVGTEAHRIRAQRGDEALCFEWNNLASLCHAVPRSASSKRRVDLVSAQSYASPDASHAKHDKQRDQH